MANGIWKHLRFDVPTGLSSARLEQYYDYYKRLAGAQWEAAGWRVLRIENPRPDDSNFGRIKKWSNQDRDHYILSGYLYRAPRQDTIVLDEKYADIFAKYGYKPKE